MKKSLVITGDSAFESICKYTHIDGADLEYAYRGSGSVIISAFRILWMKLALPCKWIWYRRIDFSRYESIVVMDTFIDADYLKFVGSRVSTKCKKHFYYWNIYKNSVLSKEQITSNGFKIWSFDYTDCTEHGFSFNPQFYAGSWYENILPVHKVDVMFVGRDKEDRVKRVDELFDRLRCQGITCNTYITARKWYQRFRDRRYGKYLDFKDMVKKECEGKAILDYGVSYQYGPTLRVYDAICNGRKVITNNSGVKELSFYSPDNFFVLGEDDEQRIVDFIEKPLSTVEKEKLEYYEVKNWVNRFV